MRRTMLVVLALLLCAGTGWSRVDAQARRRNLDLGRAIEQSWRTYLGGLEAVYLGHPGAWHGLAVDKVFLQAALRDAAARCDRRDPGSARQLDALRARIQRLFDDQEAELRSAILGEGERRLRPERKE